MTLLRFGFSEVRLNLPPGGELKVFINGIQVDTLQLPKELQEGDSFGSPSISQALGNRKIKSMHSVGTMIMITTVED
jgi:hypothetical protein